MHNLIQLEHIKQRKEQLNGYYQNNRVQKKLMKQQKFKLICVSNI